MKEPNHKHKPLKLNAWPKDWYSLGIFCAKTNTVEYALENMAILNHVGGTEKRLFDRGISEADDALLSDIAFDAGRLRERSNPQRFDYFIASHAGKAVAHDLLEAIAEAHDWETPEQKSNARAVMDTMFKGTGDARERSRLHIFGETYSVCEEEA